MTDTSAALIDIIVDAKEVVADDVTTLTLSCRDGSELPEWEPGAHIALVLQPGMERQYSLCDGGSDRRSCTIAVLREAAGRGGSIYVHDRLQAGDTIQIRPPRNNFALLPAERYLFIAGGIGITPILPMIEQAERAAVPWTLLYGGRSRGSMAFLPRLGQYGDRVTVCPQDETGLLDLAAVLDPPRENTLVYCCGPEPLLNAVGKQCASWPAGSLRLERFAPAPLAGQQVVNQEFVVELAGSGITITVPADRSLLECLQEAGADVVASCLEGTCGTCETAVVEGEPDHRDSVLTDDERAANETMFVCVSRSRGDRLVLDLDL